MKGFYFENFQNVLKSGIKLWFGISYWLVFGAFILIGWATKGIALGIVLSLLFGFGYWFINKVTGSMIKKAEKERDQRIKAYVGGIEK